MHNVYVLQSKQLLRPLAMEWPHLLLLLPLPAHLPVVPLPLLLHPQVLLGHLPLPQALEVSTKGVMFSHNLNIGSIFLSIIEKWSLCVHHNLSFIRRLFRLCALYFGSSMSFSRCSSSSPSPSPHGRGQVSPDHYDPGSTTQAQTPASPKQRRWWTFWLQPFGCQTQEHREQICLHFA